MSQEFQPLFETTPYFNSQMLSNIPMTNGNTAGNGNGNTATTPLTGNNNPLMLMRQLIYFHSQRQSFK